jgi:hypothetical protein
MRAWEEAKDSGELDSDGSSSEDEDELTGIELLRDLDPPAPCPPTGTTPAARSGRLEWPKKVLQQTNLVSSIAAEIKLNINRPTGTQIAMRGAGGCFCGRRSGWGPSQKTGGRRRSRP